MPVRRLLAPLVLLAAAPFLLWGGEPLEGATGPTLHPRLRWHHEPTRCRIDGQGLRLHSDAGTDFWQEPLGSGPFEGVDLQTARDRIDDARAELRASRRKPARLA